MNGFVLAWYCRVIVGWELRELVWAYWSAVVYCMGIVCCSFGRLGIMNWAMKIGPKIEKGLDKNWV